jgi:hypothetical protein
MAQQTERLPNEPKVHIAPETEHAVSMSNRQLGFLKYISQAPGGRLGLEELSHLNQLTVGSFRRKSRGYIVETPRKDGVQLTWEGKLALKQFEHGNFLRTVASMRFSSFLNLEVYDEGSAGKRKKRARHTKTGKAKTAAAPVNVREFVARKAG